MKLSTNVALTHDLPAGRMHEVWFDCEASQCVHCALLTLADEVQDLRLANKRMRKQHDICTCGAKRVDGICGSCPA